MKIKLLKYAFILFIGFIIGLCFQKSTPVTTHSTVLVYDTVEHYILKPTNTITLDTVFVSKIQDVDTQKILQNYFSTFVYRRMWADANLTVALVDSVSENKLVGSNLSYNILRPTTVITNNVTTFKPTTYGGLLLDPFDKKPGLFITHSRQKYNYNAQYFDNKLIIGIGYKLY